MGSFAQLSTDLLQHLAITYLSVNDISNLLDTNSTFKRLSDKSFINQLSLKYLTSDPVVALELSGIKPINRILERGAIFNKEWVDAKFKSNNVIVVIDEIEKFRKYLGEIDLMDILLDKINRVNKVSTLYKTHIRQAYNDGNLDKTSKMILILCKLDKDNMASLVYFYADLIVNYYESNNKIFYCRIIHEMPQEVFLLFREYGDTSHNVLLSNILIESGRV